MVKVKPVVKFKLPHGSSELSYIHAKTNYRKALIYWLGFLQGVLASNKIETKEYAPLHVEAENFLHLLDDPDAAELIEDLRIWKDDPREIFKIVENIIAIRSREISIECDKDTCNEFFGFCAGIACDNTITPLEVEQILKRLKKSTLIHSDLRIKNLKDVATLAIADGRISPEESEDICRWITRLVGDSTTDTGIATYGNVGTIEGAIIDSAEIIFDKRTFVVTGNFKLAPRKVLLAKIAERGGAYKDLVCKKTDYLCIASEASRDWRTSHAGNKIHRALELKAAGKGPSLVEETTLGRALALL